jgi:hypothetical protein
MKRKKRKKRGEEARTINRRGKLKRHVTGTIIQRRISSALKENL